MLLCGTAVAELPELLSLADNASNDFTIIKAGFAECVPVASAVNHELPPLYANDSGRANIHLLAAFDGARPASANLLVLLSVLRR